MATDRAAGDRPAWSAPGVYVHVPFCARRCDYCAFATFTDRDHLQAAYVDGLLAELARARADEGLAAAATVFVGGGTPSRLGPGELARLLGAIEVVDAAEVTVECNPEDVSEELLATLAGAGVTRISLGVQSLVPHVLESLGRRHDPAAVTRAVTAIGAVGFASFSVDLIYGAVGESDDDWRATLDGVLALDPRPPHVSAYALQAEPGTPLWRDRARHPDDDVQARRYELADDLLAAAGLRWYEISNFARSGAECRHNENYWRQGDYRGIGSAAHSHLAGRRWWNVRTPERYLAALAGPAGPEAGFELLDDAERRAEALELAIRTRGGVAEDALDPGCVAGLVADGLTERAGGAVVLTRRGRLLANEVACRLQAVAVAA